MVRIDQPAENRSTERYCNIPEPDLSRHARCAHWVASVQVRSYANTITGPHRLRSESPGHHTDHGGYMGGRNDLTALQRLQDARTGARLFRDPPRLAVLSHPATRFHH